MNQFLQFLQHLNLLTFLTLSLFGITVIFTMTIFRVSVLGLTCPILHIGLCLCVLAEIILAVSFDHIVFVVVEVCGVFLRRG